ncbi:protein RoBo-1-like [Acomys russatus]|uniref:protein RoBo-1-like n=1 Tax=Acomys russatus TaxID=60746 RepID=UPI0021E21E73|nr:protein RoBo-1-like [Acomys russatus]
MFWSSVLKSLLAACVVTEFAVSFVESFTCANSVSINGVYTPYDACETFQACFNQTQELKMPELARSQKFQQKGCATDECTDLAFSATLGGQRTFRYDQQCCTTDKCNQGDTQPSQGPATANGIQCLACYTEPGTLCIPTLLKCTGKETKCASVIGTVAGSSSPASVVMVGTGCATENACNLNMTILGSINIRTFCMSGFPVLPSAPASTGLRPTSISAVPVLIILPLLKVLL